MGNHRKIRTNKKSLLEKNSQLDKYYTKKDIAFKCYNLINDIIKNKICLNDVLYIEPSAGSGVFLDVMEDHEHRLGFDIEPTENNHKIQYNDFIKDDLFKLLTEDEKNKNIIFIGNPPFGKKAKLAIDFVNKSLNYSNIVGFIVPIQFRKWSVQSKINKNAQLILDVDLEEKAFEFMGKDYKVRCCFQVWVLDLKEYNFKDLRLNTKPETKHPDFEMYQYNRTEQAKKFFNYNWDFAVYRQGYQDYNFKAFKKEDCNEKQQWIFFKAKDQDTLNKLLNLDFVKLSKKNIGIPGFGKADVIQEFLQMYKKEGEHNEKK